LEQTRHGETTQDPRGAEEEQEEEGRRLLVLGGIFECWTWLTVLLGYV